MIRPHAIEVEPVFVHAADRSADAIGAQLPKLPHRIESMNWGEGQVHPDNYIMSRGKV
jgi:hypothetical protein